MLKFDQAACMRAGFGSAQAQVQPSFQPTLLPFLERSTCTGASVLPPEKNRAGPSCRAAGHQEKDYCLLSNGLLLGEYSVLYSWVTANIMSFKLLELPLFSLKKQVFKTVYIRSHETYWLDCRPDSTLRCYKWRLT